MEARGIQENILKLGEIDKMPREREKVDDNRSLTVQLGELESLES